MSALKKKKEDGVSLKEYMDSKFNEFKLYVDIRFSDIDSATRIAYAAMNSRLEGMNEFRESLKDQTAQFTTRVEHEYLVKQMDDLRIFQARQQGMATQKSVYVAYAIAIIGVLIGAFKWL